MDTNDFAKSLRQNMTEAERRLWYFLRAHRFDGQKFRRQQPIGPYIADFVHLGARLVIEADGGQHTRSGADVRRDAWFGRNGFRVLRFWNHEILQNTQAVLEQVWVVLAAGPLSPNPSPARGEGSNAGAGSGKVGDGVGRPNVRATTCDIRRGCGGPGHRGRRHDNGSNSNSNSNNRHRNHNPLLREARTMTMAPQLRIPATYMRGGTSKGVFFRLDDLPEAARAPGPARDALLMRVIGSPDPYGKHTDGMGGATSSTSKCVIISRSSRPDHDVDYLYGQVSIDTAFVDWSGNCGNLSTAVGPFAIANGFIDRARLPENGTFPVRVWQANIGKTIVCHVPIANGEVQETGDFELDGVTFPAAEIVLEFLDPADEGEDGGGGSMFPTGRLVDDLDVPGVGTLKATMINAGIPTVFVRAADIGYTGAELQGEINGDAKALAMFEAIRAHGAVRMGLIADVADAAKRQHTPKVAFVAPPRDYQASSGKTVKADEIDLLVRALSMGKLHHAMMGTAAVAIGTAAAIPGTLVNLAAGGGERTAVRFGHPSGTLRVGAEARQVDGQWQVTKAIMSRSARILMEGWVRVPGDSF